MGLTASNGSTSAIRGGHDSARPKISEPLVNSGSLSSYKQNDVTTSIGREIPDLKITEILADEKADTLIRDLAITVSQRGVVFLRNQDVTTDDLLALGQRLSNLTGSVSNDYFLPIMKLADFVSPSPILLHCTFTLSRRRTASSAIRSVSSPLSSRKPDSLKRSIC